MTELTASQNELLRATSRSFYQTLKVLPRVIRPQIALAYLLARTADTIADTEIVPVSQRREALHKLREFILGSTTAPVNFNDLAGRQGAPAEKLLLEKAGDSVATLQKFSAEDQKRIRDVLTIIISGQELDLRRFAPLESSQAGRIIPLETALELDDYTYRVAGCVGEFWTKMCRAHLFPKARIDDNQLIINGVRFGKGLQLINILRDLPEDVKKGRCYLPTEKLEKFNLTPQTVLTRVKEDSFLKLFHEYLDKAEDHLRAGWDYTNTLPYSQFRVRLACAWPILIGIKTIEKLRVSDVSELQQRVKISRKEVKGIILHSLLVCPIPALWRHLFPAKPVAFKHNLS